MATQPVSRKRKSFSRPYPLLGGIEGGPGAFRLFFDDIPLDLARDQLRELYRGWVFSERSSNCDPQLPKDLLFLYEKLDALLVEGWQQSQLKQKPNQ